jgi:hypothetical protein
MAKWPSWHLATAPGEPTFTALKKTSGGRYLYAGLDTTFAPGASRVQSPMAVGILPPLWDKGNLKSYHTAPPLSLRPMGFLGPNEAL